VRQSRSEATPVGEVSRRLGVSQHSLYDWKKEVAASNAGDNDKAAHDLLQIATRTTGSQATAISRFITVCGRPQSALNSCSQNPFPHLRTIR